MDDDNPVTGAMQMVIMEGQVWVNLTDLQRTLGDMELIAIGNPEVSNTAPGLMAVQRVLVALEIGGST